MTGFGQMWTKVPTGAVNRCCRQWVDSVDSTLWGPLTRFRPIKSGETWTNLDTGAVDTVTSVSTLEVDSVARLVLGTFVRFSGRKATQNGHQIASLRDAVDAVTTHPRFRRHSSRCRPTHKHPIWSYYYYSVTVFFQVTAPAPLWSAHRGATPSTVSTASPQWSADLVHELSAHQAESHTTQKETSR